MGSVDFTDFVYDDGGREAAGFRGEARDCVTRAIAIATGEPYVEVYETLWDAVRANSHLAEKTGTPRKGLSRAIYEGYLLRRGWEWTPTMRVGQGCTVHLRASELPSGRIICRLSRHLVAVVDGVVHDTDPEVGRDGTRCVYGIFQRRGGS